MNQYYRWLSWFVCFFFVGCSYTEIPHRIHSAASLPRSTVLDTKNDKRLSAGMSLHRGLAWTDEGENHESSLGLINLEFKPLPILAIGARPFYGYSEGSGIDKHANLGGELYSRLELIDQDKFGLWTTFSYRHSVNKAANAFCTNAEGIFISECTEYAIKAHADIHIYEPGLSAILEFHTGNDFYIALVPSLYRTKFETVNSLTNTEIVIGGQTSWHQSHFLYFVSRASDAVQFQIGFGLANAVYFSAQPKDTKWRGSVDLAFHTSF